MKKYFTIIILFAALQSHAQITKATLQASGLTCALCSKAVFKALSAVPFVEKVQPNIELSTYELRFRNGADVNLDVLGKAVVDAGFSVSMLKITANFQDTKVQNNTHIDIGKQLFHFMNVPAQTLSGEKTLNLLDKIFVTAREARKNEKLTAMSCYASGTMDGRRVYHVTL